MKPDTRIESSRRLYAGLLNLYPADFRREYAASMLQLFTDQCRIAARENGRRGMFFLWIRTLSDLAASLFREHLASPRASLGLLEGVPNQPLPWKGAFLVLIPGVVFLVGQIGQLTGGDLFFLYVHRAAYVLFAPVLLVWLFTRKFPVWGLIPLAMLYRTLIDAAYRVEYIIDSSITRIFESPASLIAGLYRGFPAVMKILSDVRLFGKTNAGDTRMAVTALMIAGLGLLFLRIARRSRFPKAASVWTGVFLAVALSEIISGLAFYLINYHWTLTKLLADNSLGTVLRDVFYSGYYFFTYDFGFLILILVGAWAARRHGRLALLLPLGYLIPTVLFGRFDYDPRMPYFLLVAGAAVLIYRVFVTIVAPIWIVRSATESAQARAGAIGLLASVGFIAAAQVLYLLVSSAAFEMELNGFSLYYSISPQLIALAGIGLALSLYKKEPEASTEPTRQEAPAKI